MIKIVLISIILIFSISGVKCNAQDQFLSTITRIEKSLLGVDYSNQNENIRLNRIEKVVYGQASSNLNITRRMNRLSKDLSADLIGHEIKPKRDTFKENEDDYKQNVLKSDSNIHYPAVDNLEKSIFNKNFSNMDINQRLTNLEQNVLKKTYKDSLSDRVDRLKFAIGPNRIASSSNGQNYYGPNDITGLASPLTDESYKRGEYLPRGFTDNAEDRDISGYRRSSNMAIPLGALEKKVLRKSFPNDTIANRLTRLESKVLNSNFSEDDEQTRLDRVASAYQAKKSSKRYDNNRFSQNMATAMQVGAFVLMILAAVI